MNFFIADQERMELGLLPFSAELDLELMQEAKNKSGCNDIALTLEAANEMVTYGNYLFCPGTEYGGRILDLKRSTSSDLSVWYLDTWRRMLGQVIIEPPEGQAYREVSGDANTVIAELLKGRFQELFIVPETLSGIQVAGRFERYTTVLEGVSKLLSGSFARLSIRAEAGGTGKPFHVCVEAVPIRDYSAEIEYSQDNKVNLSIRDYRRGINHLICLGSGQLTERMVRHLYIQKDGSIGRSPYYTGLDERTAVLDEPNAEDEAELLESGKEELLELGNYKKVEMTVQGLDLDIGDIIAARDRVTGAYLAQSIVNKVLKISKGKETITYKVKGDD